MALDDDETCDRKLSVVDIEDLVRCESGRIVTRCIRSFPRTEN
jgi:hypothetical protein